MLQSILARGAPTVAFDLSDAGGQEKTRERYLDTDELKQLFTAMKQAKSFSI